MMPSSHSRLCHFLESVAAAVVEFVQVASTDQAYLLTFEEEEVVEVHHCTLLGPEVDIDMFAAHCSMLVVVAAEIDTVAGMVAVVVGTFPAAGRHEAVEDTLVDMGVDFDEAFAAYVEVGIDSDIESAGRMVVRIAVDIVVACAAVADGAEVNQTSHDVAVVEFALPVLLVPCHDLVLSHLCQHLCLSHFSHSLLETNHCSPDHCCSSAVEAYDCHAWPSVPVHHH